MTTLTTAVLALSLLFLAASIALIRWWLVGGFSPGRPVADPGVIAFGFPESKYRALDRLLDGGEVRALQKSHAMPTDLAEGLATGRAKIVEAYLDELAADFQLAQRVVALSQATGYVANPGAVRGLIRGWIRFHRMNLTLRRKALRGQLSSAETALLVGEVRVWFARAAGNTGRPPEAGPF